MVWFICHLHFFIIPSLQTKFTNKKYHTQVKFTDVSDKQILGGMFLIFYILLNFIIVGAITDGGRVTEESGQYIFSLGDYERPSNEEEFNKFKAASIQLFSSTWIVLGYFGFIYFDLYKQKAKRTPRLRVIKHNKLLKRTNNSWFLLLRRLF